MNIGLYYSFNTRAPATLGLTYVGVQLIRTEMLNDALNIADIPTINTSVEVEVGGNVTLDTKGATYYVFRVNGSEMVFSEHWVDASTMKVTSTADVTIDIEDMKIADIPALEQQLVALGLSFKVRR